MLKTKLSLFSLVCLSSLNSCGDNDSLPNDLAPKHESSQPYHQQGGPLPARELANKPGTWRVTREQNSSTILGSPAGDAIQLYNSSSDSYTTLENTQGSFRDTFSRDVSILTIAQVGTTQTANIFCLGQDNCVTSQNEFEKQRSLFMLGGRNASGRTCEQGITEKFVTIDLTSYGIEAYCGDTLKAKVLFEHLSDDPAESLGQLAFNTDTHAPLDTNMGVSGSFNHSKSEINEGSEIYYRFNESYTIHAPYGDDELTLNITAEVNTPDKDFKIFELGRTYHFLGQGAELNDTVVLLSIKLTSDAFSNASIGHNTLTTHQGTLEVIKVDDYSANIIVNGTTYDGAPLYTAFSIDLY